MRSNKYKPLLLLAGNILAIFIVSYYVLPLFSHYRDEGWLDKEFKAITDGVYLNPELVDEKPDMAINKEQFVKSLDQILPPKVIFERFGGGYHEFLFELGITKDGKLGSIQIKKETDSPLPSTIGDFLGSHRFVQALSEIKYKPAVLEGRNVGSTMAITLIIAFDEKGNVIYPWYMKPNSSPGKIQFFDKTKNYKASEIMTQAEIMPEMIGGPEELTKKIEYPIIAKKAGIEGRVIIAGVVDESGNIIGVQVIKGLGAGLDDAAINAIRQMKFRPGRINNKAVKVKVIFPVVFKFS